MKKLLAFDIEIFKSIPDGTIDWKQYRPFGISCAATLCSDKAEPRLWYMQDKSALDSNKLRRLIAYMNYKTKQGYQILTWNGVGFDFDVLAEESGMRETCADLAINHVDMFFHIFCTLGYGPGLAKAAEGMGLSGKIEGVTGARAPELWAAGEYDKVLEYVGQDVRCTLDVALAVEKASALNWIAKSGRKNSIRIQKWLTAKEALKLPKPNTSWMTDPWPRSKFTDWMNLFAI